MRAMIYVHGHPHVGAGGSEAAAHALFRGLNSRSHESVFLGVAENGAVGGRPGLTRFTADGTEYVMPNLISDYFFFVGGHLKHVLDQVADLAIQRRIDVIHFHHFLGIGTDGLIYLRRRLPEIAFVFTAHEYLSVCARDGQMLMTDLRGRCFRPEPDKCWQCLKRGSPAHYTLREALFCQVFDGFDAVIAPSRFLAERLTEARICRSEVRVIENLSSDAGRFRQEAGEPSPAVNRFGFFGQINPFKGADVLLAAAALCRPDEVAGTAEFHLYGGLAGSLVSYPFYVAEHLAGLTNVTYHGSYDGRHVIDLMRGVDWIIVPSIWWENAPVVIEEALVAGRPIICSNIGGMAEKVEDGASGLHFEVGDAEDLARKVRLCCGNRDLWRRLVAGRRRPATADEVTARHVATYEAAIAARKRRRVSPPA